MTQFHIYTEDVNRKAIVRILDAHLTGYTIVSALGRWEGKNEPALEIRVIGGNRERVPIFDAAREIKRVNRQQSVLVTRETIASDFV